MMRQQTNFAGALGLMMIAAAACGHDSKLEQNTAVEQRLQAVLDEAVKNPNVFLPGSIVHYRHPQFSTWSGSAGFGDLPGKVAMRSHDRIRAGSAVKPFLAAVTLQLVEEGALSLDQTLIELLAEAQADQIEKADQITLRMLLGHRSGIPEWNTPEVHRLIFANPAYVWTADDFLLISSMQPRTFEPGASYSYSNTNYTVLGLVLEKVAGKSWRAQVRERVLEPLGLENTSLPEPGDSSLGGEYAHGYQPVEGEIVDVSFIDPSMAGAAGGHALVTTPEDLGRFLEALLAGELFTDPRSLVEMTTLSEGGDPSGLPHFYGLGIEAYMLPGGTKVIGHGGGTAGYSTMMFHVPDRKTTIVATSNSADYAGNAIELFLPAIEAALE